MNCSTRREKTFADALAAVPLPAGVELLEWKEILGGEVIELVSRSFSGTATTPPEDLFDWTLGPTLRGKWDDSSRLERARWFMRLLMLFGKRSGAVMLATRNTETGKINGVVGVLPYPKGTPTGLFEMWQLLGSVVPMTLTRGFGPLRDANFRARFFKSAEASLDPQHKAAYLGKPHLFVGPVAVAPESQGSGLTSKMMRHVTALADFLQWGSYLEANGPKNPRMYARYGYVSDRDGNLDDGWPLRFEENEGGRCPEGQEPYTLCFAMLREPVVMAK